MTPQEKKTLLAQAKRSGAPSVGAYLRRKALGPEDPTLDALIELVQKSTERANAAAEVRAWPPERLAAFRNTFGLTKDAQP